MLKDVEDGARAAVLLAGGTPLHDAMVGADPGDWLALDEGVREVACYSSQYEPEWERVAPLTADEDLEHADESRLALALCHRKGRIRQKAVRWSVRHPALLPLLVIRCADWAAPVRETARRALREVLDAESAVHLASLILRVGRRDRGDFAVEVLGELLGGASRTRLGPLFASPDRTVRRFAYRLAVERRLFTPAELARAAARDPDTVVQDLCATAALAALRDKEAYAETDEVAYADTYEEAHSDTYEDVLSPLLNARNPRTRSAGVTGLRRAGRAEQAEAFLGDRSGLVRACARYVVRRHGGDPTAWYRAQCTAPEEPGLPPGAVIGLAEGGDRADAGLLLPLLAHPAAGVRAQAVAGLRLLERTTTEQLRPFLDDPAAGVVRETVLALLPSAKDLPADWLLERLGAERPQHVRRAAFRLLDARGGAVAPGAAAGLLDDPDPKLRMWAEQSVQRRRPSMEVQVVRPGPAPTGEPTELLADQPLRESRWAPGL
ncbi:hypothetical protein OKJ48_29800 [Streptomyces kunmingensis]|uniref:HEAT repeat domain-containing protein n=1 Tax=Streptomyces kunmingensis TaxID=68225 RepID=A0ABU6CJW2_9ACTN|nr:hypothetical protein [Streptomyces kunmingensis]MEB3964397.1 hypothetical protein [Streptomyces kunmingensis]